MSKLKHNGGRPHAQIDWNLVDSLLGIQCTQVEVCEIIGVSKDTIARHCKSEKNMSYEEYSDQKGANGRISLRRKQYDVAMSGDRVMLIWLGKQWLGQSEKVEQQNTHKFGNLTDEQVDRAITERLKNESK